MNGVTGNPTEWLEFVAELACDLAEAKAASVRAIYNTPTCLDPTDTKTKLVGFLKSTAIGQMVSKVYDIMVEACSSPVQKYASTDALLCLGIIMCRDQPTSLLSLHRTLMTATQQHQVVLDTSTPSSLTASSTSTVTSPPVITSPWRHHAIPKAAVQSCEARVKPEIGFNFRCCCLILLVFVVSAVEVVDLEMACLG